MTTLIVRRSRTGILILLAGFGAPIAGWLIARLGVVTIDGASSWIFTAFILLFAVPVFLYACALWRHRHRPLLLLDRDFLELHYGPFLSRAYRIALGDIEAVRTNWAGPNSDSKMDLIFTLADSAAAAAKASGALRHRGSEWHFQFATAEISPLEAVLRIEEHIRS